MLQERLLVTGATGMVGSLVAQRAVAKGYQVRAMVRPSSARESLEELGIELIDADLARPRLCRPPSPMSTSLFTPRLMSVTGVQRKSTGRSM